MKLVLAIICSLVLAGTPFLLAQSQLPECAKEAVPACCQHGGEMPCCAAKNSSPQNTPAVPSQNNTQQNLIPVPVLSAVICKLPENPADAISSTTVFFPTANAVPLFARNCARLI
jgi:hypothetical protein